MPDTLHEEYFRVTSCQHYGSKYTIFTGVPLKADSYSINSGKYIVSIQCENHSLPIKPSVGQQWRVRGIRARESIQAGDYALQQHLYDAPAEMECTLPETGEAIIRFIATEKDFIGIGEAKARSLWETFGSDLHDVLKSDTPEHRERLRGVLSEVSVDALYNGYAKYRNLPHANWLASLNVPLRIQQRILKYHDERTVDVLKRDPYALLGFGMPFSDIDTIAERMGFEKSAPVRLAAALESALRKQVGKGHTYATHQTLKPDVGKFLGDTELVAEAFAHGHRNGQFVLRPETGTYHPTAQVMMESVVAKRLRKLALQTDLYDQEADRACMASIAEMPYELTQRQAQAVATSLDNAVSCITGGAGTGKTTVLRTALRALNTLGYEIHAVALSGRAAIRLQESIGFLTRTIAGLLRQEPIDPTADQPLHLLVIDESSMIDLPTMYRLVTHISPDVRIIFTGDPDQLPPIGCGKVLSDIVASGLIANTTLDIVKRQEGSTGIPEYSKMINQGIVPVQLSAGAVYFHETPRHKVAEQCTALFTEAPEGSRILSATKALVADINQRVQKAVNPGGKRMEFELQGDRFYREICQGDSVLFTQNNYDAGIQNGSLGTLISAEATEELFGLVQLDTGTEVVLTQAIQESMELGYCITLHKAQGSQFPRVIIALQQGRIVDRAWLYTAITRAESEVHIVGTGSELTAIIQAPSLAHQRLSYLEQLMSEKKNP